VSFSLGDVPRLARSTVGRAIILHALIFRFWPLLIVPGSLYRRAILRKTRLVAVIGTFGKTTTTRALKAAFGLPWNHADANNSHSWLTRALFAIRPDVLTGVIEVGINKPGQMAGYQRLLRPDIVVVTNIGTEHNRALGTLEATRNEKAEMLRRLSADGLVVLNGDDPNVRWMAGQTSASVTMVGFSTNCQIRASDYTLEWPSGSRFTLHGCGEPLEVRTRLIGRHQVYPILAAVAVASASGLPLDRILKKLEALEPTYGRLQPCALPNGAWLLRDDLKASVETADAALSTFAEVPARNKIALLGEIWDPPGDEAQAYGRLGERAAQIANRLILVGRSADWYAAGARRAGMKDDDVLMRAGREVQAIAAELRNLLATGDVALVNDSGNYRLDRLPLILTGRQVRCRVVKCQVRYMNCPTCPMLERGWDGVPTIF